MIASNRIKGDLANIHRMKKHAYIVCEFLSDALKDSKLLADVPLRDQYIEAALRHAHGLHLTLENIEHAIPFQKEKSE